MYASQSRKGSAAERYRLPACVRERNAIGENSRQQRLDRNVERQSRGRATDSSDRRSACSAGHAPKFAAIIDRVAVECDCMFCPRLDECARACKAQLFAARYDDTNVRSPGDRTSREEHGNHSACVVYRSRRAVAREADNQWNGGEKGDEA